MGAPPLLVPRPGGRSVAVDDVGDPTGAPVVYLHGTPDSRLARHPDDALAAAAGVRLLAVDRPGYGRTDPRAPGAGPLAFADDVAAVLDRLGVERCGALAWSGGALDALAVAAGLGGRVASLTIAAGLVPRQAYDDPAVAAAAPGRADLLVLADDLGPGGLGEVVAPLLAPYPCDDALALEHQVEQRDAVGAAEVASVPGLAATMAAALVEGVRQGLAGVAADVEAQNHPFPVDLATVTCPTRLWWGTADTVTPPAFAAWYERALPRATATLVEGAGHYLPLTHWRQALAGAAP
jgi:pimeloyl-ACP methyl ester carboxylesterase